MHYLNKIMYFIMTNKIIYFWKSLSHYIYIMALCCGNSCIRERRTDPLPSEPIKQEVKTSPKVETQDIMYSSTPPAVPRASAATRRPSASPQYTASEVATLLLAQR